MSVTRALGILRLGTRFPRNPGDAGYAGSWAMPVRIGVVAGASPARVVRRPGVLTVDADALNAAHLLAAGADALTPIVGLAQGCGLQRTLLEDRATLDPVVARADAVSAAMCLVQAHPDIDSVVLERTNLPPYAQADRKSVV